MKPIQSEERVQFSCFIRVASQAIQRLFATSPLVRLAAIKFLQVSTVQKQIFTWRSKNALKTVSGLTKTLIIISSFALIEHFYFLLMQTFHSAFTLWLAHSFFSFHPFSAVSRLQGEKAHQRNHRKAHPNLLGLFLVRCSLSGFRADLSTLLKRIRLTFGCLSLISFLALSSASTTPFTSTILNPTSVNQLSQFWFFQ